MIESITDSTMGLMSSRLSLFSKIIKTCEVQYEKTLRESIEQVFEVKTSQGAESDKVGSSRLQPSDRFQLLSNTECIVD